MSGPTLIPAEVAACRYGLAGTRRPGGALEPFPSLADACARIEELRRGRPLGEIADNPLVWGEGADEQRRAVRVVIPTITPRSNLDLRLIVQGESLDQVKVAIARAQERGQ